MEETTTAKRFFRFVLIFGIVNGFADLTYEGARSISGPFLGTLGASAAAVGIVAGLGELAGYGLRSISGYVADRTHRYWIVVFVGYLINMLAVPALALAGNWPMAALLIVAERTGRAIRRPAVEGMLAHAGTKIGHGWVFGLNEALDQTGATVGPLVTALVLYLDGGYRHAFAALLVSALLCLATLLVARANRPPRDEADEHSNQQGSSERFSKAFWLNVVGGALFAAGFADFSLIAFHFQKTSTVAPAMIPLFYSVAMATGAISALVLGRWLDRRPVPTLISGFALSALAAPFAFLGGTSGALAGMILWGIGLGAQDSILKAVVSIHAPSERRSTSFGLFDTVFGVAWFVGSAAMGLLYSKSVLGLVLVSVVLQLAALPVLFVANKGLRIRSPARQDA